ncbi:MAG: hypothetical protein ACO22Z_09130, partial [Paracoccaceae bacterium]
WLRQMFSGARGPGRAARRGAERGGDADTGAAPAEGDGPVLSAAALRHRLGRIVAAEPADAPLSDAALAERLAKDTGVRLARRTVAQYREAERIPPAHRRKRFGFGARGGVGPAATRKRRVRVDPVSPARDVALDVPGDST